MTRQQCLQEFYHWCRQLAQGKYLDILSIGSSQLSQSNFGENWEGKANGGGVPVNSEQEYREIWKNASPMLVRTYSATRNTCEMAAMYERTINISWHALSLWWFNELDGRDRIPCIPIYRSISVPSGRLLEEENLWKQMCRTILRSEAVTM